MEFQVVVKLVLIDRVNQEYGECRKGDEEAYIVPISTTHLEPAIPGNPGRLWVSITDDVGEAMTA